jgi:cytochrome P450
VITIPDLASPTFKADPYPLYAELRAKHPVLRVILRDKRPAWLITRFADVQAALKDERLSKNVFATLSEAERAAKAPWTPKFVRPLSRNMLQLDVPDHTRLRALVSQAFSPRFVEQLRGRIEALCIQLIPNMRARGAADLVEDFALPLPMTVIAEMFGVSERDRRKFRRWSQRAVGLSSTLDMVLALPMFWQLLNYLRRLSRDRRSALGEDLLSGLSRAEQAEDRLDEDEIVAMLFLVLIAGHETTVNLISSGMLALLDAPDQLERLRADRSLLKPAVEELLRFASPVEIATERYAREPVSYAGVEIPRGERVLAVIGAAHRDPEQFLDPDRLDVGRTPNRHLAFGYGIHHCLGAALARIEAAVALNALLDHTPSLTLRVPRERLAWRRSLLLRGLDALPVTLS